MTWPHNDAPIGFGTGPRPWHRSLAAGLSPLQVQVERIEQIFRVTMSPMPVHEASTSWTRIECGDGDERALNLLLAEPGDEPPAVLVTRWEIPATVVRAAHVLLDDRSLASTLSLVEPARLRMVRFEGPVELDRVERLVDGIGQSSPASIVDEPRAIAAMEASDDHVMVIESRELEHALVPVADNFRRYLAVVCRSDSEAYSAPPTDVLSSVLADGVTLTARPIETQVYSTFVDVGVRLSTGPGTGPANSSLIYDVPSQSWHAEQ
ncbi:MAG: hypothetical protein ACYTGC_01230 [Planctomycetota bacterium]|jgi:hypothetical protein